jgi:hypothetical protein
MSEDQTPQEPDRVRPTPDLAFVATDALVDELAKRHPEGCIVFLRGTEGEGEFYRHNFRGRRPRLVRMVGMIRQRLAKS